jgi:hypothetical protein
LKRTKLDEIPQLLNVVRGHMNLVGPRPIRPIFLATSMREIQNYAARFVVCPGMTGLAQLRGGYFTHPRDKLRYDILYIRNRTMLLDVKLVLGTFVKLLNRWLTLGLLLALIFLSATFLPALFRGPVELAFGGFNLSPFEALGLLLVGVALARQIPAHRLYIYRTPTNWPMLAFVAFCVATAFGSGEMIPRLRDLAYFTGSGFPAFPWLPATWTRASRGERRGSSRSRRSRSRSSASSKSCSSRRQGTTSRASRRRSEAR